MHENPIHDSLLIQRVLRGDQQAAAQLYYRYVDRVHAIAYRIILDQALAHDAAQEVWLKVFRKLDQVNPEQPFSAWLSTVTTRTAIDFYRKRSRIQQIFIEDADGILGDEPAVGKEQAEQMEIQERIEHALLGLTETQRAAFILRHFEGQDLKDIAATLGCETGTVKTHLYRAVQVLRKSLSSLKEQYL
jgi:RNA polymerase sigma-70 factor (ECF subfamily)